MAGDLPHILFAHDPYYSGSLMIAVDRGGKGKWLQDFSNVVFRFHDAHVTWDGSDASLPGLTLTLDVLPMSDAPGFCARLAVKGAKLGDKLIWAYGATRRPPGGVGSVAGTLDPMAAPDLTTRGFTPEDCRDNVVSVDHGVFSVSPPTKDTRRAVVGRCSTDCKLSISDAAAWRDPVALVSAAMAAPTLPVVVGVAPLTDTDVFWAMQSFDADKPVVSGNPFPETVNARINNPAASFQAGMRRAEAIGKQVVVDTPDEYLNAAVPAACSTIEGLFRTQQIMHGGLSWNMPYMGWRTMYGTTALGWHDIVRATAKMYMATQEKADTKKAPHADPALNYTAEAMDSRFYGLGHLNHPDQWRYDMQSLLFDMAIHAWRWTGDPELEKSLRDSLDLHLKWMADCFDPDGDGLYESYQNVAEVDQVWYNGGGTAEETAYAYTGHVAAMDLARKAGDAKMTAYHKRQADKIKKALMRLLWIPDKGYVGAYREQGGLKRLHEDSWLYSIFLPIDAKMLTEAQSVQAMHYTEWGLQRDKMPLGGVRVWTSNWVPTTWSARMRWNAHAYSLSLAYCQAGLPDEAWEVMKGGFLESSYNYLVPGGFDGEGVGMDFHETSCTFARSVVEGLFGYRPDHPNGVVRCAPSFPSKWDHASIKTPDFSLSFKRGRGADTYALQLTNAAKVVFSVPVRAKSVVSVAVDGKPVAWESLPGYGHSIVSVVLPKRKSVRLTLKWAGALPQYEPIATAGVAGNPIVLRAKQGKIVKIEDPQKILSATKIENGVVNAALTRNAGHHLVLALADDGKLKQWQIFKLKITDPKAEAAEAAKLVKVIPKDAKWTCLNISDQFNADVKTIFEQKYMSPRPQTCSVRLAADGFASWPFLFWGVKLPVIDLSNVGKLLVSEIAYPAPPRTRGRLMTPQGAPFDWQGGERNIAFTSQWDNWPRSVTIPVGKKGKAAWLLVCGSTNQMQGKIANAQVRLKYTSGAVDKLDIIPPYNFWSLCGLPDGKDYDVKRDAFVLDGKLPNSVQLGANCRAILLNRRLRPNTTLESVTLETLSQDVVIGIMGVTVME